MNFKPTVKKLFKNLETELWMVSNSFRANNNPMRRFSNWNANFECTDRLASRCELEQKTEGLIMDTFIQNMNNKTVEERLCTDRKNQPKEALRFAIAFEEGIAQQQNFTGGSAMKKETLYAIVGRGKNQCTRV